MKAFFVFAAATVAAVNAAECDLAKLIPLLSNPSVQACTKETGWQPPIPPTDADFPKVCVDSCKGALTALEGLGLGDCSIRGTIMLETSLIKPVKAKCGWGGAAPTTAPPTKAPTPGTPSTNGPPTSSTPSTSKPVC